MRLLHFQTLSIVNILYSTCFVQEASSFILSTNGMNKALRSKSSSTSNKYNVLTSSLPNDDILVQNADISFDPNSSNVLNKDYYSKRIRFLSALPSVTTHQIGDDVDRNIIKTAVPSMLNMAVVPIVNSVDTFWVGRLGIALALAGQAAANQVFFTFYFLVSFLPTITAPLVATAVGSGDTDEARDRICEALFLCNLLGILGTMILVGFPQTGLGLVLSKNSTAMRYAIPYLRFRALSMIPALISSIGFSAYRGLLNTVTPLKVSLVTNMVNLISDPVLIRIFGVSGAAMATAGAEGLSGLIYLKLLMRRKLLIFSKMFAAPSWSSLEPLIKGGAAMLLFQLVINVAFTVAARRVQTMDPTGISAAAYGKSS